MGRTLKIFGFLIFLGVVITIAIYGAAYYAVAKGWTDVEGEVDTNNAKYEKSFQESVDADRSQTASAQVDNSKLTLFEKNKCMLKQLDKTYPINSDKIRSAYRTSKSHEIVSRMLNSTAIKSETLAKLYEPCPAFSEISVELSDNNLYAWVNTEEWPIIVEAIGKDKELIDRAAIEVGLEPRLLATPLAVEQLRLYFSQREFYEKFFKPLKILVTTNQMAWGVMAIKQKSAVSIENNLKDSNSSYYLGQKYENLLDFSTSDIEGERMRRLSNERDHYWSYLYGAVYIKQLLTQWQNAGYPIDKRPEVVSTLYNLGLEKSKPKSNPEVGGSTLDIARGNYTFGGLAYEIYYSGEMIDIFPYSPPSAN